MIRTPRKQPGLSNRSQHTTESSLSSLFLRYPSKGPWLDDWDTQYVAFGTPSGIGQPHSELLSDLPIHGKYLPVDIIAVLN